MSQSSKKTTPTKPRGGGNRKPGQQQQQQQKGGNSQKTGGPMRGAKKPQPKSLGATPIAPPSPSLVIHGKRGRGGAFTRRDVDSHVADAAVFSMSAESLDDPRVIQDQHFPPLHYHSDDHSDLSDHHDDDNDDHDHDHHHHHDDDNDHENDLAPPKSHQDHKGSYESRHRERYGEQPQKNVNVSTGDELADLELALYLSTIEDASPARGKPDPSALSKRKSDSPARHSKRKEEISLNHLLRFSISSSSPLSALPSSSSPSKSSLQSQYLTVLKKELYIQANHRILLHSGGDYRSLLENADTAVRWQDVARLYLDISETKSYCCPICLETPRVPKMTPCGHVFCWVCLLQLVAFSASKTVLQCPMCTDTVVMTDLRSVLLTPRPKLVPGTQIEMVLMKRYRESTFTAPASYWNSHNSSELANLDILPHSDPISRFARFATTNSIAEIVEIEQSQLEEDLFEARSCQDRSIPFIEAALSQLEEDHKQIRQRFEERTRTRQIYLSGNSGMISGPEDSRKKGESSSKNNVFLYYQSADGQLYFLDPLNSRMLLTEFGSFQNFPEKITANVLSIHSHHMEPEIRRRCPWLSYLPLSTPFSFVELSLKRIVSPETLQQFSKELNIRKKQRKKNSPKPISSSSSSSSSSLSSSSSSSSSVSSTTTAAATTTTSLSTSPSTTPLSSSPPSTSSSSLSPSISSPPVETTYPQIGRGSSFADILKSSTESSPLSPVPITPPNWGRGGTFADVLKTSPQKPVVQKKQPNKRGEQITLFSTQTYRRR